MSLFESSRAYGAKYEVVREQKLGAAELASISECTVVRGDFGNLQIAMTLTNKAVKYFGLNPSQAEKFAEGQVIDPKSVTLVELSRPGDPNIIRANIED